MEDEWHVSDSEGEEERQHYAQFMISNLKGLCTSANVHRSDPSNHTPDQLYVPKKLNALYTQIKNDGFISLRCKGSKRRLETMENEPHTVNNHKNQTITSQVTCVNASPTQGAETSDEALSNMKTIAKSEFDYDEEMMDTMPMVKLPRRKPKSEHDKYRKTKRVGTMEKVISDLSRFERLNAQVMAADHTTQY